MCSVIEIRPDDHHDYNRITADLKINEFLEYLKNNDVKVKEIRRLTYSDFKSFGADPYNAAEALCRLFDPTQDIYVHILLNRNWNDNFDDIVHVLRERCYRVVSVRADWVG